MDKPGAGGSQALGQRHAVLVGGGDGVGVQAAGERGGWPRGAGIGGEVALEGLQAAVVRHGGRGRGRGGRRQGGQGEQWHPRR